jgi:hypothetical protein
MLALVRRSAGARVWMVGSPAHQAAVAGDVEKTLAILDAAPPSRSERPKRRVVADRLRARGAPFDAQFFALVSPGTANGSLVHSAPTVGLDETRDDALVAYLAVNVFSGGGTQSFYKRMWGAALAYSDYVRTSPRAEQIIFYADRIASIPQLLRFADAEVRRLGADPGFVDYAVVPAFWSRTADTFEARARAMAVDLAEGRSPERVQAFRERLLALRSRPGLAEAIHAAQIPALGKVVPSLAGPGPLPDGALYFVTGPETAIQAYEKEIVAARGAGTKVLRLWPRDFWDAPAGAPTKR